MITTPKADRLDTLFAEREPIVAEHDRLAYDAENKLRMDTTPEEEARIEALITQMDVITRKILDVLKHG